jgi:hypothetical protein
MSRPWRAALALARFEALRMARSRATGLGLLIFAGAHGIGIWRELGRDRLFITAVFVSWALSFRPGLSEDRALGFDRLLVIDFTGSWGYALGKVAGATAWTVGYVLICAALSASTLLIDPGLVVWNGTIILLALLAASPLVLGTDLVLKTSLPAGAALFVFFLTAFVAVALGVEAIRLATWLGYNVTRGHPGSLVPLATRAAGGVVLAALLVAAAAHVRLGPSAAKSA